MWRAIGILVVVLVVAATGAVWFGFSQLGAAIARYGSAATHTRVTVGAVGVSLATRAGTISSVVVGNPDGFSTPNALAVGAITVRVDPASLTRSGPILIQEVDIEQPRITYEVGARGSNLETIARNAQGDTGSTAAAPGAQRKIIIEDLYVRDGEIAVSASVLHGHALTVPLPDIHLSRIGSDGGGATPAQIASTLADAISSKALKAGSRGLTHALASGLIDPATGVVKHVKAPLGGLFGN
jgi:hypothetical protein